MSYQSVIIPSTPGGILAKMLKDVAEKESEPGIKLKIIEKGGRTLSRMFQSSNPTASDKCGKQNCYMDNQIEGRSQCHKNNIIYEWVCRKCDAKYVGETSRNFYSRSLEHIDKLMSKSDESFIFNHQRECHQGQEPDFKVRVLKSFQDALSRQVYEGVHIRNIQGQSLNTKLDYYQASSYRMRREVIHG